MKIVVVSDNHCNQDILEKILFDNPNADYYWHLGDSESYADNLSPFISVCGNNDYDNKFPDTLILEKAGHRFMLTHGHRQLMFGIKGLAAFGKEKGCDVVLYGHTHNPSDNTIDGIRLINPGSCLHNRTGMKPSYCVLNINEKGDIFAELKIIENDNDKL